MRVPNSSTTNIKIGFVSWRNYWQFSSWHLGGIVRVSLLSFVSFSDFAVIVLALVVSFGRCSRFIYNLDAIPGTSGWQCGDDLGSWA